MIVLTVNVFSIGKLLLIAVSNAINDKLLLLLLLLLLLMVNSHIDSK